MRDIYHDINLYIKKEYNITSNSAIEECRVSEYGDITSNAAMINAKKYKIAPYILAAEMAPKIQKLEYVKSVRVDKPGFINITLDVDCLYDVIHEINNEKSLCGLQNIGNGEKVNIEFVSANPTGPLHIGHCRNAILLDAIASMMEKNGYKITREYYINDAGNQINKLIDSVHYQYLNILNIQPDKNLEDIQYSGEYIKDIAQEIIADYQDKFINLTDNTNEIKNIILDIILKGIKKTLKSINIIHDVFVSEQNDIHNKGIITEAIKIIEKKDLLYQGKTEKPLGKDYEEWESKEITLFKSTEFGDDVDRPVTKQDGNWTYFAADMGYHHHKIKRNFNQMIIGLGSDHYGYIKRLKAIVGALSDNKAEIDIKISNLVNYFDNGQSIKMSKRTGNFLTIDEVIEKVPADVVRFIMLTRREDSMIDFDMHKVKEASNDNPIFYIQYAYARANSVISKYTGNFDDVQLKLLQNENEISIIKKLAKWPYIIKNAVLSRSPTIICSYLLCLAENYHSLWNAGNQNNEVKFIVEDDEKSKARIYLNIAINNVILSGFNILNITPIEKM
ncbi:MAG: arginine--tRNA ligase [Anaplasmataceae bacterium]|nr:arginine--tRNA ligase [Anaplasmataceae bacterium]